MKRDKSFESLLKLGFTLSQAEQFSRLRVVYAEKEGIATELRRLEFVRWLVSTGRLTDEFVTLDI